MEQIDLLLINPPFHLRNGGGNFFPLGLGYLMAAAERNCDFSYKVIDCSKYITSFYSDDLEFLKIQLCKELQSYSPLAVGIGPCITTQVRALKIIADCCKEIFSSSIIFAGGPLASIDDQEWFFYEYLGIENIIKGDGEVAIIEALSCVMQGKELSCCDKVTTKDHKFINKIPNINSIAFPTRLPLMDGKASIRRSAETELTRTASMITSRGCVYQCNYCVSGNISYKEFRKRSYENIAEEMLQINKEYGVNDVIFYDDCFFHNPQTANKDIYLFCRLLLERKINMKWQMEIRPDLLMELNNESILLLEKSGCRQINIGIEKTSIEGLNFLGKKISLYGLAENITQVKKVSNIHISGTFILGGGDENVSDIMKIIDDSTNLNLDFAHYNPLFVYPGTPIYNMVFSNKEDWVSYILEDSLPWGEVVYENKYVNKDELLELVEHAYNKFYAKSKYRKSQMVSDRFNLKRGKYCENV
ncbi:radical SAM protein [Acetobacterium sp.]|uniref:B12-binding domain-containing radical SAM protein n=1 Tax=Acetobacterium sp. TaxID=1872094 RepID=UPI003594696E